MSAPALSPAEVAKRLACSPVLAKELMSLGLIDSFRVGSAYRTMPEDLNRYVERLQSGEARLELPEQTYFIAITGTRFFKVGKSNRPWRRLRQIQVSNPLPCVMVVVLREDREAEIHDALRRFRGRGEWFTASRRALLALRRLGLRSAADGIEAEASEEFRP